MDVDANLEAETNSEMLGALMGGAGGGPPPDAAAGPVTQNTPSINIVNNNRNLTAPAGTFANMQQAQQGFNMGFDSYSD